LRGYGRIGRRTTDGPPDYLVQGPVPVAKVSQTRDFTVSRCALNLSRSLVS